jgi:hypothetical protein
MWRDRAAVNREIVAALQLVIVTARTTVADYVGDDSPSFSFTISVKGSAKCRRSGQN